MEKIFSYFYYTPFDKQRNREVMNWTKGCKSCQHFMLIGSYKEQFLHWALHKNEISTKCDQIYRKLQIWSHLLKKSLMENFIFCAEGLVLTQNISENRQIF